MSHAGNHTTVTFLTNLSPETANSLYRIIPFSITFNERLSCTELRVYNIIAGVINIDTNRGQISHEGIAQLANISARSVIRAVKVLESMELITVERAPKGTKIPNIYHLTGESASVTLRMRPQVTQDQPKRNQETVPQSTQTVITDIESHKGLSTDKKSYSQLTTNHTKSAFHVTEWQTHKEESVEMIKENDPVVVESEIPIFKLDGVEDKTMLLWTKQYGVTRVKEVLDALPRQKNVQHVPGWVASALKHGWEFGKTKVQKPKQQMYAENDGRRYISGKYAEFLHY